LKIASIQLNNYMGDKQASFASAEKLILKAAQNGAKLAVLPELSSCGYIPNSAIWQYAEYANGETAKWACNMAGKYSLHIGAGYVETDGKDFYNTYLIACPNSTIAGQVRKVKVEYHCFKPCDIGNVIATNLGAIAIGICADNHLLAFYKKLARLNFDLLLMPHASFAPFKTTGYISQKDIEAQKNILPAIGKIYSQGLGTPAVIANQVGTFAPMGGLFGKLVNPDTYKLCGGSSLFYNGEIVASLDSQIKGVLIADLPLGKSKAKTDTPASYSGWLHPGSKLIRKVVAPIDTFFGKCSYSLKRKKAIANLF